MQKVFKQAIMLLASAAILFAISGCSEATPKTVFLYEVSNNDSYVWLAVLDDGEVVKAAGDSSIAEKIDAAETPFTLTRALLDNGARIQMISQEEASTLDDQADKIEEDNNYVHTTLSVDEISGPVTYAVTDTGEKILIKKDGSAPLLNVSDAATSIFNITNDIVASSL